MAVPSRPQDAGADPADEVDDTDRIPISTHCTNPDRTVFIEKGNSDGWIATDFTVALDR